MTDPVSLVLVARRKINYWKLWMRAALIVVGGGFHRISCMLAIMCILGLG